MIKGTPGNDVIGVGRTSSANDYVFGRGGDDWIDGLGGNDRLFGDAGDDTLIGGLGNDTLNGGSGNDTLAGGDDNDRLVGGAGNDTMSGGAGNDTYIVNDTTDSVMEATGGGNDTVYTSVNYTLAAGQEIETLRARGAVSLMLTGNEFDNFLFGSVGDDILDTGTGNDTVRAGAGNDLITTSGASAVIHAGKGDDTIRVDGSSTSAGYVEGGDGYDTVRSADLGEFVFRSVETLDTYYGFLNGSVSQLASFANFTADLAAPDAQISISLRGAGGALDFTTSIGGLNSVEIRDSGLTSAINITGSVNADALNGSAFNDRLNGGNGEDSLSGGDGRDALDGGAGNDRLNGGSGSDILTGSTGDDVFVFDAPIGGGTNIDRIADFTQGSDLIEINEDYVFAGLTVGQLNQMQFAVGSATGNGPQIVYNASTGALFYDSNGAGAGGASQFAVVVGAPMLTASDFWVV